ncbi:hypothetical protein [Paenibacillus antarcticus]|uniref:Uncharacterized protein n=1 Tax=Paenibacillus antarcticus TaxID=253703 RepID=A0A168P9G1_9BACL|nr:hypothetical protein [Paenibacillus antarcticus]OAB46530.1 hypothetical protein PBAT_10955 [Paenibacillus antarcticus]
MKKQIVSLLMSSVLVLSIAGVASADGGNLTSPLANSTSATTSHSSIAIDLGPNANDDLFASGAISNYINSQKNHTNVSQRATDGRNMSYTYNNLYNFITTDFLPLQTYGNVPLQVVQTSDSTTYKANVTYQFANESGTKRSTVFQIPGNITETAQLMSFTNVPQGTASDPIYLIIVNKTANALKIRGNGHTLF